MEKVGHFLNRNQSIGIFILRLFIGARLLYGVVDNVFSWEHMREFSVFLEANNFPLPMASAILSVYTQFLCGILITIGYKTRIASTLLIVNFIVALVFVHIRANDSIEGMTPALAILFICVCLLFTGAGKLSIDDYIKNKSQSA